MNSILVDPDVKINMSLDEIIQLSRDQINSQLSRKNSKNRRKKNKKRINTDTNDHSAPLLSSPYGAGLWVSKNSSLLNAEHKRRITEAFSNRALNADLIEKSKRVIPAQYQLIRTSQGVERVLVPAKQHFARPAKLVPPRKINKESCTLRTSYSYPPPLMALEITPPEKMDVDEDDDIAMLNCPQTKEQHEVIGIQLDVPVDVLEARKLCMPPSVLSGGSVKTLSERFTLLTGNFRF